jgi:hypothetical protein
MPCLFICAGKNCRKLKAHRKIQKSKLLSDVYLQDVKCQKICRGAVVGFEVKGKLHWFKSVKKKGHIKAIKRSIKGRPLSLDLVKRHVGPSGSYR